MGIRQSNVNMSHLVISFVGPINLLNSISSRTEAKTYFPPEIRYVSFIIYSSISFYPRYIALLYGVNKRLSNFIVSLPDNRVSKAL